MKIILQTAFPLLSPFHTEHFLDKAFNKCYTGVSSFFILALFLVNIFQSCVLGCILSYEFCPCEVYVCTQSLQFTFTKIMKRA